MNKTAPSSVFLDFLDYANSQNVPLSPFVNNETLPGYYDRNVTPDPKRPRVLCITETRTLRVLQLIVAFTKNGFSAIPLLGRVNSGPFRADVD